MSSPHLINPFLHLARSADESPRDVFAYTADQSISNAEAAALVRQIAYEMRRRGVRAGDVVATSMPDALGMLFTMAIFHEGAVGTVLPDELVAAPPIDVAWLFTTSAVSEIAGAQTVRVDATLLRHIHENPGGIRPSDDPLDVLRITFSSGTTGAPKAIPLRRTMERAIDAVLPSWFRAEPIVNLMGVETASGVGELFISVKAARPYVAAGNLQPADVLALIDRTGARSVKGSVAQISALLDEAERQERSLESIDVVQTSGTALPVDLADRIERATGGCSIVVHYGSTEAGVACIRTYRSEDPADAGHPVPGSTIEVVDEAGAVLPVGVVGRVRHRAAGMVDAYLGNPSATATSFQDGWFYPGDLGSLREDGGLTLAGRSAELLNAGGVKVDPARIDETARTHPGVRDACAFGFADADSLPCIGLAVVADADSDLDALIPRLAAAFGPAAPQLIARVDAIARTATGKPLRRTLTERFSVAG